MSKAEPTLVLIEIELFNAQVALFKDQDEWASQMEDNGVPLYKEERPNYGIARCDDHPKNGRYFSLIIPEKASIGTIVHECVHMADFVMEYYGVPTDAENTEIRAYMTERLFERVMFMRPKAKRMKTRKKIAA